MNVTRQVVEDLLPLYASGEASPDTRALVEEFLGKDPELVQLAAALELNAPPSTAGGASRETGYTALLRAKALLRMRAWLMGFGLFFTAVPLSFQVDDQGFRFLILRDAPSLAMASWVAALGVWSAYAWTWHRTRVTGL